MSNTQFRETFRIAPTHPALPGHFPGRPVVPGVVLLDRVAAALRALARRSASADCRRSNSCVRCCRTQDGRTGARGRRQKYTFSASRTAGDDRQRQHRGCAVSDGLERAARSRRRAAPSRLSVSLVLRVGPRQSHAALLYPATLYFFLRRGPERRASRAFLTRAFGRPATLGRCCAIMLHLFGDDARPGVPAVGIVAAVSTCSVARPRRSCEAQMARGRGVLLLGAHIGSFEIAAHARREAARRARLRGHGSAADAGADRDAARAQSDDRRATSSMPAPIRPSSRWRCTPRRSEGALIGLLGRSRAPRRSRARCRILRRAARHFRSRPYLIASLLELPVVLCFGLYRGGNRYDLYFETFADRTAPRAQRARRADSAQWAQRYARAARALHAPGSLQLVQPL